MAFPDLRPLKVKIEIFDSDTPTTAEYTFNAFDLANREFDLTALGFKLARGGNNSATIGISDPQRNLVDMTDKYAPGKIKPEWHLQLSLGKTSAGLERWLYGRIKDVIIDREQTNDTQLLLNVGGWSTLMGDRITTLIRHQAKESDGETPDTSDTTTQISELIKDVFEDTDHQLDDNITQISGFTVASATDGTGLCDECLSIQLPHTNFSYSTYATVIGTLCGISNTDWTIDGDRRLIAHDVFQHSSGLLMTNDTELTTLDAQNWPKAKTCFIMDDPIEWSDSSNKSYYGFIHAVGHFGPSLDVSTETAPDAADALDGNWHAVPFTTNGSSIMKIATRSIKVGTPASDTKIGIWGDNAGTPNEDDQRHTIKVQKSTLQGLGTSTPANWFELDVRPKLDVNPGEQLYLVYPAYGSASNTYSVNYKSGTGTYYTSSDGTNGSWSSATGDTAYRVWEGKRKVTTLELPKVNQAVDQPREHMFTMRANLESLTVRDALKAAGSSLGKVRRLYSPLRITPPDSRISPIYYTRLYDSETGLDVKAGISNIEGNASVSDGELGINSLTVELEDFR